MRIVDIIEATTGYKYKWPDSYVEDYTSSIVYRASAGDGEHLIRVGIAARETYGRNRARVTVWIDDYPHAEFVGADDFESSGDVLSEVKIPGDVGERICRYPAEAIPERYTAFNLVGLPTRVSGPGVHQAWAVVANVADHSAMAALAGLRRLERGR